MKLWGLEPKEGQGEEGQPWWANCACIMYVLVRAETEGRARELAANEAGCESGFAWLSAEHSSCVELTRDGEEGILMQDERYLSPY